MTDKYLYNANYQITDEDLFSLEMRSIFGFTPAEKIFFSDKKIKPSISPFLKNRLQILYKTDTYDELLETLSSNKISEDGFKIKYVDLPLDDHCATEKRKMCREVALTFEGTHSYDEPNIYYGLAYYNNHWYFGILEKNDLSWKTHSKKPYSYSSSLGINLAKALVNIAGKADFSTKLIDPCCGAGTVLLEAIHAGYSIVGGEINYKVANNARTNLEHFGYKTQIITGDIQKISEKYDVSIVDLPYGISVKASDETRLMIIRNAIRISNKIVLVSSTEMMDVITSENLKILDSCIVYKNENRSFARFVWVLES